jgi:hypothetical protein
LGIDFCVVSLIKKNTDNLPANNFKFYTQLQTKRTAFDRSTRFFMTFAETSKDSVNRLFFFLLHCVKFENQNYKND